MLRQYTTNSNKNKIEEGWGLGNEQDTQQVLACEEADAQQPPPLPRIHELKHKNNTTECSDKKIR